ncbi:FHA domain-containing protein [Candidatus Uabimicrobium sp. HlEnr_7]|uniref:FHA domain-containing protein n=1 Tax=Candidatus Uabimicrobium helgolandensis TaxID=3095367 RepID=UPI003556C2F6
MIVFRILSGGKEGKIVKSDLDVIYAGRKPECILQLDPYQDLSVHGQHAKIYKSSGYYYLEDLNSKNGTFVNDQPVKTPIQLKQGLVFRLGVDGPEVEVYDCKVDDQEKSSSKIENTFFLKRLDTDTVFNFDKKSVRLGRQPDCELALDPLKNREVSGYHALICCGDDGYYLEDLQSANGTFLNGVVCKNSKLQNLDIVQLGKEGPKFQFLYHGNDQSVVVPDDSLPEKIIIAEEETLAPDTKENVVSKQQIDATETKELIVAQDKTPTIKSPKKKIKRVKKRNQVLAKIKEKSQRYTNNIQDFDIYKKVKNYTNDRKKESIVIAVVVFILVIIFFGAFSQKTYDEKGIYTNYSEVVVPVYSRYLVKINGKIIRGQTYSTGVLYHSDGKTKIIALRASLYPWENQSENPVEKLVHVVAVWPSRMPIFDKSLGYNTLDFTHSYNNDYARIGGKKIGNIKMQNEKLCKITIDGVIPFALPQQKIILNSKLTEEQMKVFSIYTSPKDGIRDNGTLNKVVTEGFVKNTRLTISCNSYGAPIFNIYGEIIGMYFENNLVPINY